MDHGGWVARVEREREQLSLKGAEILQLRGQTQLKEVDCKKTCKKQAVHACEASWLYINFLIWLPDTFRYGRTASNICIVYNIYVKIKCICILFKVNFKNLDLFLASQNRQVKMLEENAQVCFSLCISLRSKWSMTRMLRERNLFPMISHFTGLEVKPAL